MFFDNWLSRYGLLENFIAVLCEWNGTGKCMTVLTTIAFCTLCSQAKNILNKKLRKSQKTIEQKNTKANNYSIFIYLFRYVSSVEKDASFSLLALIPLL